MKRRAALVADVRGWAFDVNLRAMADYVPGWDYEFYYVVEMAPKDWAPLAEHDAIFTPYHRWHIPPGSLPWEKRLGSLRAQWFTPTRPAPAGPLEYALVNQYAGFHVVTARNLDELRPHCPHAVYLTNPVDMRRFTEPTRLTSVIFEWNGNAQHGDDVKGLHGILGPAVKAAGADFVLAEYNTRRLPHEAMPAFYRTANVALCASLYEGASNSVMEAMACGLRVLSTDCGNIREIRDSQIAHFGETGIDIVARSREAFEAAMRRAIDAGPARALALGELNRAEIDARWSWAAWARRYADFLGMVTT